MTERTSTAGRRLAPIRRGSVAVKAIAALVALAGLAGGGYWTLIRPSSGGENGAQNRATADIAVASKIDFEIITLASGELAAKNQVEIRSQLETMSTVVEVVAEGTRVKKGDLLIKLNGDNLEKEIQEQDLELYGARADKVAAETGVRNQEGENESLLRKAQLKIDLAKLAVDQWKLGDVKKMKEELDQGIRRAERDLERLKVKAQQSVDLNARGFLSDDEKELDLIALDEAETKLTTARLDKQTYWDYQYPQDEKQKNSDVTEAEAEFIRVRDNNEIQLTAKKAQLEKATQQLAKREENFAKLNSQLEKCTVYAPTDGLVVYASSLNGDFFWDNNGPMRIGRNISPNDLMIVLPDTSEMVSTVRVHESLAGRIRPGLSATMKIEAVGNAVFTGKVESIGVLAETSGWRDPNRREYTVKLVMDPGQDGEKLKPSMRCEATIQLGKVEDALAVPLQAVFNDGPVRYVFIPKGGKFVKRPVNIGQRSDAYAEITAGLEPSTRVLVRQPASTEILDTPWDPEELKVCGLKLDERGEPVAINPEGGRDRRGGRGDGAVAGGPEGRGRGGDGPTDRKVIETAAEEKPGADAESGDAQGEEPAADDAGQDGTDSGATDAAESDAGSTATEETTAAAPAATPATTPSGTGGQ
jgi:HlyD family secretion protein